MSENDVQFEEDSTQSSQSSVLYSRFQPSSRPPALVRLLLKLGIVKTTTQANHLLLGTVILFFALAIYIFGQTAGWFSSATPSYREDVPPEVRATLPPEILDSLPSRNQ